MPRPYSAAADRAARRNQIEERQQTEKWWIDNRCQHWNATIPIGTPVRYFSTAKVETSFVDTKTRSEAWVMGGDDLVVMIEGVSGCVPCTHLRILPMQSAGTSDEQ